MLSALIAVVSAFEESAVTWVIAYNLKKEIFYEINKTKS